MVERDGVCYFLGIGRGHLRSVVKSLAGFGFPGWWRRAYGFVLYLASERAASGVVASAVAFLRWSVLTFTDLYLV